MNNVQLYVVLFMVAASILSSIVKKAKEAAEQRRVQLEIEKRRLEALRTGRNEDDAREVGDAEARDRDALVPEDDLGLGGDDDLAVGREADVEVERVGAVGLGQVEGLDGVLDGLPGRAATGDDEGRTASEDVHSARDYPRAR